MTYDIYFGRPRADGAELESVPVDLEEADDEPRPVHLTAEQRAIWDRVVHRAVEELGHVETEEYMSGPVLRYEGPRGVFQLDYSGDSAYMEIPYWYLRDEALAVLAAAYHLGRILEEESGLEGEDLQLGRRITAGDPRPAAVQMGAITQWTRESLGLTPGPVAEAGP
ncbi:MULTISPECIES: hypothetical protein [Streptosporangium]|uniref:Uncharacterized protein n=1 Tax=Streptosporangium brasiliense TaxID=47480 RepID=A0ABT9R6K1_9ACTN|nr:hypothetical protein [Streptosporangium brasiliense]MDP9864870.1 hypothetical protein [Streptosporangium brasiliense]